METTSLPVFYHVSLDLEKKQCEIVASNTKAEGEGRGNEALLNISIANIQNFKINIKFEHEIDPNSEILTKKDQIVDHIYKKVKTKYEDNRCWLTDLIDSLMSCFLFLGYETNAFKMGELDNNLKNAKQEIKKEKALVTKENQVFTFRPPDPALKTRNIERKNLEKMNQQEINALVIEEAKNGPKFNNYTNYTCIQEIEINGKSYIKGYFTELNTIACSLPYLFFKACFKEFASKVEKPIMTEIGAGSYFNFTAEYLKGMIEFIRAKAKEGAVFTLSVEDADYTQTNQESFGDIRKKKECYWRNGLDFVYQPGSDKKSRLPIKDHVYIHRSQVVIKEKEDDSIHFTSQKLALVPYPEDFDPQYRGEFNKETSAYVPLEEIFGKEAEFRMSYQEIADLWDSQKIFLTDYLPTPFFNGIKQALLQDRNSFPFNSTHYNTLPGKDSFQYTIQDYWDDVPAVDLKDTNFKKEHPNLTWFIQMVRKSPEQYGFASEADFLEFSKLNLYQLASNIIKVEDCYLLSDSNWQLRDREVGDQGVPAKKI